MSVTAERGAVSVDREFLSEMYWDRAMTQAKIADELGVTRARISQLMHEFGIPTRGSGLTDEQILDAIRELADELGHPPTAREWEELGRHQYETVKRRFGTYSQGRHIALEGTG